MTDKVRPIKPSEVGERKASNFPGEVFEAFNEMIAAKFSDREATFTQKEVVALMVQKGLNGDEIFKKGWLDVEEAYEAAGWKVEFDQPGFNETFTATFTFKRRSK